MAAGKLSLHWPSLGLFGVGWGRRKGERGNWVEGGWPKMGWLGKEGGVRIWWFGNPQAVQL